MPGKKKLKKESAMWVMDNMEQNLLKRRVSCSGIFFWWSKFISVQFSCSCLTLCNPTHCRMPGFPVHYQFLELAQTYVHWVSDAIQPSHPLSSPSPFKDFLVAQLVKNPPAMPETWFRTLGWADPLKKGKATHSSILAWRIPWTA